MARRANNLNGKDWLRHSISVWKDIKAGKRKNGHPAAFPEELVLRLMDAFLYIDEKEAERPWVCDPFLGSGTTLLAASTKGVNGLGFELEPSFFDLACKNLEARGYQGQNDTQEGHRVFSSPPSSLELHRGDARKLGAMIKENCLDLTITSPPYWDIMHQRRSADKKRSRPYSQAGDDLGNIPMYDQFIQEQKKVFRHVFRGTRPQGYLIVVVMDLRKGKDFYPLHMDMAQAIVELGFTLDDMIIWDRGQEYNSLRPLGYPYVFRINKIHEYLLIFQKRE